MSSFSDGLVGFGKFVLPEQPNLRDTEQQISKVNQQADALGNERANYKPAAPRTTTAATVDTTQGDQTRGQQQQAIAALTAAANGQAPSAAELQAKAQADRAAAQQFGMAAAMGGRSPGGALRQASTGAAQVQGQVANDSATLRAAEMAQARGALTGALSGVRTQDQDAAQAQAALNQQTNLANLGAATTSDSQNLDWRKALLQQQMDALGIATGGETSLTNARVKSAEADNNYKGGLFKTFGNVLGSL